MSTVVQKISLVFGIVFLAIGALGFVLGGSSMSAEPLLGMFKVNIVHNIVHLAFGLWGVVSVRSEKAALSYMQIAGVVYLVLSLLGFFAPSGFGFVPIGGHNIWLHGVLALILLYFGFGDSISEELSKEMTEIE
jgi:hypothetical protein